MVFPHVNTSLSALLWGDRFGFIVFAKQSRFGVTGESASLWHSRWSRPKDELSKRWNLIYKTNSNIHSQFVVLAPLFPSCDPLYFFLSCGRGCVLIHHAEIWSRHDGFLRQHANTRPFVKSGAAGQVISGLR